jgi:hypothetical protein
MEGVLPEDNHAVKFVAVYDDGTDSHACPPNKPMFTPIIRNVV